MPNAAVEGSALSRKPIVEADTVRSIPATATLLVAAVIGVAAGFVVWLLGNPRLAPLAGWDIAVMAFNAWVVLTIFRMDPDDTKAHATRDDPGRIGANTLLLIASVASLGAVGFLLTHAGDAHGTHRLVLVGLGTVSVIVSWTLVHILFTLRYARIYYGEQDEAIDFHQDGPPCYLDFVYMSFTVGMTFQVSDTDIKSRTVRATVLHQALLSYLFGTGIVATAINLVAGLSK